MKGILIIFIFLILICCTAETSNKVLKEHKESIISHLANTKLENTDFQVKSNYKKDFNINNYYGVVTVDNTEVFNNGSIIANPIGILNKGTVVELIGFSNDIFKKSVNYFHYYLINDVSGNKGWIYGGDIAIIAKVDSAHPWYEWDDSSRLYLSIIRKDIGLYVFRYGQDMMKNPTNYVIEIKGNNILGSKGSVTIGSKWNINIFWNIENYCFTAQENRIGEEYKYIKNFHENIELIQYDKKYESRDNYLFWMYFYENDIKQIEKLLSNGMIINKNEYFDAGYSPAKIAVDNNNIEFAEHLIKLGFPTEFCSNGEDVVLLNDYLKLINK